MNTTLTVPIKNAAQYSAIMAIIGQDVTPSGTTATAATTKLAKATKTKSAEPVEEVEDVSDITMSDLRDDMSSDDPSEFGEDFGGEEVEEAPKVISAADLKNKLLPALNGYSKKHGKDKTVAILKKFANASKDVKESDLPKILKSLKV